MDTAKLQAIPRGDSPGAGDVVPFYLSTGPPEVTSTAAWNASDFGHRGDTWQECSVWFEAMPGAFFQLGNLFLLFAFMAGGSSEVAATFTHFTVAVAFASLAVWGYMDACGWDILAWALLLFLVNVVQLIVTCRRSKHIQSIMSKDGMGRLHGSRFCPFDISPQLFVELVTCAGCEITHMEAGQKYAVEDTTPARRISLLLSGRMKVLHKEKFLHYISSDAFIDSPEWLAGGEGKSSSIPLFKVTIVADTDCTFISWRRKGLQNVLSKHKRLGKIFSFMIGKDVSSKLYSLNDRCTTDRGFRYDIRLPCIMSLPEDVEKRKKAMAAAHSAPGTPGMEDGRRHRQKRLGKTAAAKYAKVFASKLRARVSMRSAQKPIVQVRREPLKEED